MDRIEQLERRLERMEAINEILNLMNLYETYHSANRRLVPDKDEKFLALWAQKRLMYSLKLALWVALMVTKGSVNIPKILEKLKRI